MSKINKFKNAIDFYSTLKYLCIKKGVLINEFLERLKISESTLAGWRRGSIPKIETLRRIAGYFELDLDDLINIPNDVDLNPKNDWLERIKKVCYENRIDVYPLGRKLGIGSDTVAGWVKNNSKPKSSTIKKIADYFEVSPIYLAGYTDDPYDFGEGTDDVNFDSPIYIEFLRQTGNNEKEAIKRYRAFEKAKERDAMSEAPRIKNYNDGENYGIIGDNGLLSTNAPTNQEQESLTNQEKELLSLFRDLSELEKAKVIVYIDNLKPKKKG